MSGSLSPPFYCFVRGFSGCLTTRWAANLWRMPPQEFASWSIANLLVIHASHPALPPCSSAAPRLFWISSLRWVMTSPLPELTFRKHGYWINDKTGIYSWEPFESHIFLPKVCRGLYKRVKANKRLFVMLTWLPSRPCTRMNWKGDRCRSSGINIFLVCFYLNVFSTNSVTCSTFHQNKGGEMGF